GDNRVTVEFHHRVAVTSATLPIDASERAIGAVRALWNLGPLSRLPIDGGDAQLFGAMEKSTAPSSADADALQQLAQRIGPLARAPDPASEREARLERIHALSGLLPVLAGALDLETVFEQLSATTRHVLPHDMSVVGLYASKRRQLRLHP